MFRYLIVPVLMALLLVPDWAGAIGRRRPLFAQRAQPVAYSYPVQYSQPVYYPAPPVQSYPAYACTPCCPAVPAVAPAKPTVVPERMEQTPTKPKSNVQTEPLAQPKAIEPDPSFKPAAGTGETVPAMKDPIPVVPVPKPKEPEMIPVIPTLTPKEADPLPALPSLKFDTKLEKKEEPKKEELPKLAFPKLELPSVPPLATPSPIEPLPTPSTVKSSPLNEGFGRLKIERFPVDGTAPASPNTLRLVTFYNFSGRELTLTIAGKEVTVPSKHSVEAKLPTAFQWQLGAVAQADGAIPLSAPGLDIVIGK